MRFIFLFLLILICFIPGLSQSTEISASETSEVEKQKQEIVQLKKTIADVKDKVESQKEIVYYIIGFFTLFSLFGAGITFFSYRNNERRADASEQRSAGIHSLTIENDKTSQQRSNQIFEESQKTLTLVNETLKLATEASSRASKSLENRLNLTMKELERESISTIEQSEAYTDDKLLTQDKNICSEIHRVGRKIEGLMNNIVILENTQFKLDPHCCFIKGAHDYLEEQFYDAIKSWEDTIQHEKTPANLKSLAYFWIGYVNNNLHDFRKAIINFRGALEFANETREFELRRIQIETRFFNKESNSDLVSDMNSLIQELNVKQTINFNREVEKQKIRMLTTLGNLYHQIGNEEEDAIRKKDYYTLAKRTFGELLNIKEDTDIVSHIANMKDGKRDKEKWVIFGYAEAIFMLGEIEPAQKLYKNFIMRLAGNEFIRREEKRTKVLARTTQLICSIRAKLLENVNEYRLSVESTLSDADKRLTIYSQFQRRNVTIQDFRDDLESFMSSNLPKQELIN